MPEPHSRDARASLLLCTTTSTASHAQRWLPRSSGRGSRGPCHIPAIQAPLCTATRAPAPNALSQARVPERGSSRCSCQWRGHWVGSWRCIECRRLPGRRPEKCGLLSRWWGR
eukprot:1160144-Pelagomonas_calceolata.AAC.9